MAIDSNLAFAPEFIRPIVQLCTEAYRNTWSAENRVRYSSRIETILRTSNDRNILITVNPKLVRDFSGKEKCFIYEVIRLAAVEFPEIKYLVEELRELYKRRGYQNDRYFYLESLSDNQFVYEIDCILTPRFRSRRLYYEKLNGFFGRKQLTFLEIIQQYLFPDIIEINRPKPKKKIRHKGYRDHGSLGSEYSKTLKQQAGDWTLRLQEERKKKELDDYLKFLSGFAGWE